ncbi:MAG: hypothetical protein KH936_06620 [Neisseria sp.]|uniref:hypothetical protein n=1 Tax=Neisseria sicca TaxID=490 RepID=UPI00114D1E11|nr:hypothetical protein [Neisseria sicca]MBS6045259.1 hypothetical protein [Neisseria sp.]
MGFAHEKTTLFIARFGNQTVDSVGRAYATIRSRHCNAIPAVVVDLPGRESVDYLGFTLFHHKNLKRSSETHKHMVLEDLLSFQSVFQTTLQ